MAQSHAEGLGEAMLEPDKDQGQTPESGSYSWSTQRHQPFVSMKGKARGCDLRKGPTFVVPAPWVLCLWVPQFLSVDQLSVMWAKGVGGRVYELLGFCSSKAVSLHKLIDPFLAPW